MILPDWAFSKQWDELKDESVEQYHQRKQDIIRQYKAMVNERGLPILKFNMNKEATLVWGNDINWDEVKAHARTNMSRYPINEERWPSAYGMEDWHCPYCADSKAFQMKILSPRYEGFIENGGIYAKCLCVKERVKGG